MVTTDFFQRTSSKTYMVKVYLILYESVDGEVIMAFFKVEEYIPSRMVSSTFFYILLKLIPSLVTHVSSKAQTNYLLFSAL